MTKAKNVDEYIENLPPDQAKAAVEVREVIKKAAPEAEESIAYGIPAYKLNGKRLLYFAAFTHH